MSTPNDDDRVQAFFGTVPGIITLVVVGLVLVVAFVVAVLS